MAARMDGIVPIRPFEVPWETRYCASLATPRSIVSPLENFFCVATEKSGLQCDEVESRMQMQAKTDVNMCCSENVML